MKEREEEIRAMSIFLTSHTHQTYYMNMYSLLHIIHMYTCTYICVHCTYLEV